MENPLKFIHINNDAANQQDYLSNTAKRKNRSRTVAVLSLSPQSVRRIAAEFLNNTSDQPTLAPMTVGVAVVSLDDNYNKATGRDQSVGQMKEVDIKVQSVKVDEDQVTVTLEKYENIRLSLRLNKKTGFSTVYGRLTY